MKQISYSKLWKLLIDKKMSKKDLRLASGVSTASMAKLRNCKNVMMDVLIKICSALDCQLSDIAELLPPDDAEN